MAGTTKSALEFNLHHQFTTDESITHNFVLLGIHDCYNIHRRCRQLLPRFSVSDDACSPNKVSWPLTNFCFASLHCNYLICNLVCKSRTYNWPHPLLTTPPKLLIMHKYHQLQKFWREPCMYMVFLYRYFWFLLLYCMQCWMLSWGCLPEFKVAVSIAYSYC